MIEISAKLIREETAVYVTGEKVECFIEFAHPIEQENSDCVIEHLAWASVQLHCYCSTTCNIKREKSNLSLVESFNKTALDNVAQGGDVLVSTKPKILFCDLKLNPGESKKYFFSEFIPRDGPPTYRGYDIKYFYKIIIATQRVKSKVQTLTVPVRVLPVPIIARPEEYTSNETHEDFKPTNPFLEKKEITELELSWDHLMNLTARRMPKFYRITNKRGFVGRFCLFKNDYKLGEDIVGTMDFTDRDVRCVQFSVKLQCEEFLIKNSKTEEIIEKFKENMNLDTTTKPIQSIEGGNGAATTSQQSDITGRITNYTSYHEFCLSMLQTQIIVPVPLTVTPSFDTNIVNVRWRLHFEFVTSTMMDFGGPDPDSGEWTAPEEIPVETMIWDLPIKLWPTSPLQIWTPPSNYSMIMK